MTKIFCLVCGCEQDEVQKMHCFPKVLNKSQLWQENMGMVFSGETLQNHRICSRHFTQESYLNGAEWKLCRNAAPTLFPCSTDQSKQSEPAEESREQVQGLSEQMEYAEANTSGTSRQEMQGLSEQMEYAEASTSDTSRQERELVFRGIKHFERTPRKMRLASIVKSKEAQIRGLKKLCKARKKDVRALSDLTDSQVIGSLFVGMSRSTRDFLIAQLRCATRQPKGRRWSTEEKAVALALFKRSPSGYNFLRQLVAFPSKRTILGLLEKVPFSPGINKHIFTHIKQCITTEKDACVTLLFDEIDIKQHLEYDKKQNRIVGYEDYGPNSKTSSRVANKALVYMVCGLGDKKWKQPIAYYFSSGGCSSQTIKRCTEAVLSACQNLANLEVVTTICDMAPANVKAVSYCGVTMEKPFFHYNDKKIFVIFDPPHLLKRTASLFRQYNVSLPVDISGETTRMEARFEDIKRAYQIDSSSPLIFRSLHKIRPEHLAPKIKYSMKVNIASQVMSHTVAAYIYTLASKNELQQRSVATATFVHQVNDLFDSVNGSRITQPGDGGNVLRCCATAHSGHMKFWGKAVSQVQSWEFQRRTKDGLLKAMPPSQKGWISTLNGIMGIWELLVSKGFQSLKTRALNQDPLENLFGSIRGGCGRADNPTVTQFVGSLKTQIINGLSTRQVGGNCEEDEAVLLSNLHNFLHYEEESEGSSEINVEDVSQPSSLTNIADQITDAVIAGESSTLSVAYVSGFIVKRAFDAVGGCSVCTANLTGAPEELHNLFIEFKEWSSVTHHLKYPSVEMAVAVGHAVKLIELQLEKSPNARHIGDILQTLIKEKVSFAFVQCTHHSVVLVEQIIKAVINISLPWWCKRMNINIKDSRAQKKKVDKFKHL